MACKRIFYFLILAILMTNLTGCNFMQEKVEMKAFKHKEAGFSLDVPKTWKMVEKKDNKVVFKSTEEPITFYVREEIGGIALYAPEEVAQLVADEFKGFMKNMKITRDSYSYSMGEKAYRMVIHGKIEGVDYQAKLFVREQDLGIRHYLIFISPKEYFYEADSITEVIAKSFKLTSDDIDLYKKLSPHYNKDDKKSQDTEKNKKDEN